MHPYRLLFGLLFSCALFAVQAQTDVLVAAVHTIPLSGISKTVEYRPVPLFHTNYDDFEDFFNRHLSYPELAQENALEGMVVLSLWVSSSGKVTQVEIAQSAHHLLDQAALDAAAQLPKLLPALHNGEKIGKRVLVPLYFRLH